MTSLPHSLKAPFPEQNIGCQELLSRGNFRHSGMLMKQLTHRRHKPFLTSFLHKLPWVERYVVICDGCLYHYTNSQAKKPSGSYSLFGYHRVIRAGDIPIKKHPWAFKIVHLDRKDHSKYFSAPSEREMNNWMKEIKAELIVANADMIRKQNITVSEDDDLENSVYGDSEELVKANSVHIKKASAGTENENDDDDDDDEYLEIDEELQKSVPVRANGKSVSPKSRLAKMPFQNPNSQTNKDESPSDGSQGKTRPPMPLPGHSAPQPAPRKKAETPQTSSLSNCPGKRDSGSSADEATPRASTESKHSYFAGTPVPQPPNYKVNKGRKPSLDNKNMSPTMDEAYWAGYNKKEGDKIIQDISKEGVYLIRDSEQCAKTLVCFADGKLAKYKIRQNADSTYNIQEGTTFSTITSLLKYYHENKLPNKSTALTKPYTQYCDEGNYSSVDP